MQFGGPLDPSPPCSLQKVNLYGPHRQVSLASPFQASFTNRQHLQEIRGMETGGASIPRAPSLPGCIGSAVSLHQKPQLHTASLPRGSMTIHPLILLGLEGRCVLFLEVSLHSACPQLEGLANSFLMQYKYAIYFLLKLLQIGEFIFSQMLYLKESFIIIFIFHDFKFAWFKFA